jgi:hypothetical protein
MDGGVFKTGDGGGSWNQINSVLPSDVVISLAMDYQCFPFGINCPLGST